MPLFVVQTEKTLDDLVAALLRSRVSQASKAAAVSALRASNPGVDLERLQPGTTVVVPRLAGARARATDPLDEATNDLLASIDEGLAGLADAAERGEALRRAEREEVDQVFASDEVKGLARRDSELRRTLEELRASLEESDVAAQQHAEDLGESLEAWKSDLDTLRALLG